MPNPTDAKLTRNQSLVLEALSGANGPLSAYDILDRLRPAGLRSPLQVYRALGVLTEHGRVHRLESVNAFVACARPHEHAGPGAQGSATVAFAICGTCGQVDEFADAEVGARLQGWADGHGFRLAGITVEMRGTCAQCLAA